MQFGGPEVLKIIQGQRPRPAPGGSRSGRRGHDQPHRHPDEKRPTSGIDEGSPAALCGGQISRWVCERHRRERARCPAGERRHGRGGHAPTLGRRPCRNAGHRPGRVQLFSTAVGPDEQLVLSKALIRLATMGLSALGRWTFPHWQNQGDRFGQWLVRSSWPQRHARPCGQAELPGPGRGAEGSRVVTQLQAAGF